VVDDEAMTVSAIKHQLRRRYQVYGATSAAEGLEMMARHDFSVVICDERMPVTAGHQLLARISERWPNTARILMTAYADLPALIRAVNYGQISAYVSKPWNPDELALVVERAVTMRELVREKQRVDRELKDANDHLKRVIGRLRDFTHAVAHDLQEPLRTITAYASILEEDLGPTLDAEPRQFIDGISRCSGHLRALIDDLLLFSEVERLPLRHRHVSLDEIVRQSISMLDGALAGQAAEVVVQGALPLVNGDANRLTVLFQNLISNGLKFNRSPHRRVEIAPAPAPAGRLAVVVRDNGIGIPHEHHERIFQIFHRLHSKAEYPGTGAGLAIARQVAEVHGGTLTLAPTEGAGTTFRLELPAVSAG
jgi:light-regulated signal transduction histidine kinase (bacteriophytochrome)